MGEVIGRRGDGGWRGGDEPAISSVVFIQDLEGSGGMVNIVVMERIFRREYRQRRFEH